MKRILAVLAILAVNAAAAKTVTVAEKTGKAIQAAIDEVAKSGGGKVIVPAGVYPSRTLYLRSRVELHLEKDAIVRGGTNSSDYARFPSKVAKMGRSLLQAWDAEDIALTGEGAFEIPGLAFFDTEKRRFERFYLPRSGRPEMVLFHRCRNVTFRDVSFLRSPSWTMRLRLCENLDFRRIKVLNDHKFINADGIDFDGCRHVRLSDSDFLTGDDSIIMRAIREKGQTEKIVMEDAVIENCRLDSACQCIRIGCPSDDTIRDIHFRGLTMKGYNGVNFDYPAVYLSRTDEGYVDVRDITFENVSGELDGCAVRIACASGVKIRGVRDVLFRNFDVKSKKPLDFRGNVYSPVERIRRENFTLNGERLADGEFVADCTSAKPLRRTKKGEYNYKEPVPYVPPKFVAVAERTGAAIQKAIDEVAANETGGCVQVPAGDYPSGTIRLKSRVEVRLAKGARLVGEVLRVTAEDATDVALTGAGALAGGTGRIVELVRCRGVRLDGFTVVGAPKGWLSVRDCDDVSAAGVQVSGRDAKDVRAFVALRATAPWDGATVPLLSDEQKRFMRMSREERAVFFDDERKDLERAVKRIGSTPQPVRLAWRGGEGPYAVTVTKRGAAKPFLVVSVTNDSVEVWNCEIAADYDWTVSDGAETAKAAFRTEDQAPRLIRWPGTRNVRDMGGRVMPDGRRVRQGLVFRSAGLNDNAKKGDKGPGKVRFTPETVRYILDTFGIKTDIDLRSDRELNGMSVSPLGPTVRFVHEWDNYRDYAQVHRGGKEATAFIFRLFMDRKNYPIDFHCIGGADRTGTVASLLHGVLGASDEDIWKDYQVTAWQGGVNDAKHLGWFKSFVKSFDKYEGDTLSKRIVAYFREIGFTDDDLNKIRDLLLEPK